MAKKKQLGTKPKARVVATFRHPINVEIIEPAFVPLAAVKTLDVGKLGKGSHTVEVGVLDGGCCPKLVRAVIRSGMVTGLEVTHCEDSEQVRIKDMPREVAAIVEKAKRQVGRQSWKPVPVEEFFANMARQSGSYPPRAGTGAGCFYICLWHYCVFCCYWDFPTFCWIETRKPDVEM